MRIMGTHTTGSAVRIHISSKNGNQFTCNTSNYVPFAVPGLSASSSSTTPSPTPPSSSSQDSVFDVNRYTENPVPERSGSTSGELRGDPLHETIEIENKNKKRNQKKYKEMYRMNCPIGHRNSGKFWLMNSVGETQSKEVKALPSHVMNFQWSREQKWNRVRVSTVSTLISRETEIATSA